MTLEQWLKKGEAHLLASPHPDRARRDAETLLLHVIRTARAALLVRWKEVLEQEEADRYLELIERREVGEPIQQIIGETEFYGLPFHVTRDVLIPRPETEHLVEKVIEFSGSFAQPHILDVGTGSGAIAVTLAAKLPKAIIWAVDLSAAALAVAQRNAERNSVLDRIRFLKGNLLTPVAGELFDIIVSNPPYVPASDRDSLSVEVRDYEPAMALFAGPDGLDIYRRLIPDAFQSLASGGFLALEIGYNQSKPIHALLTGAGFMHIEFIPDLQGIPRVVCARR